MSARVLTISAAPPPQPRLAPPPLVPSSSSSSSSATRGTTVVDQSRSRVRSRRIVTPGDRAWSIGARLAAENPHISPWYSPARHRESIIVVMTRSSRWRHRSRWNARRYRRRRRRHPLPRRWSGLDMMQDTPGASADDRASKSVLLNTFVVKKKRCRVYLHRGTLIWETERPPYSKRAICRPWRAGKFLRRKISSRNYVDSRWSPFEAKYFAKVIGAKGTGSRLYFN